MPGAAPKGAGSHMSSTWAGRVEVGNRSSQGPAQQATATVFSSKVATAVVVFYATTPWWDPHTNTLLWEASTHVSPELGHEAEHPLSFFPKAVVRSQLVRSKQSSLLTVVTEKVASPEARKRKSERELIQSSGHSLGHGESGKPATALPTGVTVYTPLQTGNTLSSDVC